MTHGPVNENPMPTASTNNVSKDSVRKDLKEQARAVRKMKPRLSALARLYKERKSTIDQFVEWYGNKTWWEKTLAGGFVLSSSYMVGVFMGAALVVSFLITSLYAIATSLMEDHAEVMKKRDDLFLVEIQEMEALIEERINAFRLLETQLKAVFASLDAMHNKRSENIAAFEENIDTVESHNLRYASVIDSLKNTAEKLSRHEGDVALNEVEIELLYSDLKSNIHESQTLASTLSGLVSEVEKELKSSPKPKEGNHQDDVEAPSIAAQVEADFGDIDREMEALFDPCAKAASSSSESEDEFDDIDQALAGLRRKGSDVASASIKVSQNGPSLFSSAMHNLL